MLKVFGTGGAGFERRGEKGDIVLKRDNLQVAAQERALVQESTADILF